MIPVIAPEDLPFADLTAYRLSMPSLLDFFFPLRSLSGAEGSRWITEEERNMITLRPLLLSQEVLRQRGLTHIDFVLAAGSYDDSPLLKKAILTFKYKRIPGLADDLARFMNQSMDGLPLPPKGGPFVLCPVPLHWTRLFHRGFNQALLLANTIGAAKEWPVVELLSRIRPTGHQAWRPREERLTALKGAFRAATKTSMPSSVLLIDDLCTTGATLDECARALKEAGVSYVGAMVAAYG
jgi:ComF family protein